MKRVITVTLFVLTIVLGIGAKDKKTKKPQATALDQYVKDADARVTTDAAALSVGSTWSNYSVMTDLTHDPRASRVDDVVTIVVAESASAVSTGATQTSRKSSANTSVTGIPGVKSAAALAILSNLAHMTGDTELNGAGTTSRTTTLNTELTARVLHVMPNGFLVVEGNKNIQVNSEWQVVSVRGVVRPADLTSDNTISSGRIAQLEVKLDGKGVVNDAIRRPNFLYRMLLGLLPF
jgi:flagellar L-ring protein precursor FlgH